MTFNLLKLDNLKVLRPNFLNVDHSALGLLDFLLGVQHKMLDKQNQETSPQKRFLKGADGLLYTFKTGLTCIDVSLMRAIICSVLRWAFVLERFKVLYK